MKATPAPSIHFPLAREKGPIPFPTSKAMAAPAPADQPAEAQPSAEELRLMADTMPGDGPGD